jgi:prepilin-type N-terminal cleavage/methylation domain-containing protein
MKPKKNQKKGGALRRKNFLPTIWRRGFTLIEICIMLVILAILMGVIAPGMPSAMAEAGVRSDARQLSLMVKTAMLQSVEEHRVYVLDLDEKNMSLGPIALPLQTKTMQSPLIPISHWNRRRIPPKTGLSMRKINCCCPILKVAVSGNRSSPRNGSFGRASSAPRSRFVLRAARPGWK